MSSTQYIKIFNDTVLKQSILQGYETQRTNSSLGKFTMGELAFTRDTGRVFVGTYTDIDNKKSSDISYEPGGLLVGNKYYGASNGGKTPENYTHYPSYNSKYKVYNGDYTFDTTTSSLILFDNTITKSNNVTDTICDDGFIRMRILEPDGDTINYDSDKTSRNVLKADFTTERFFKLLSNDTFKTFISSNKEDENNGKITLKNVKLTSDATLEVPSKITIQSTTKDENDVQNEVQKSISFSEITNNKMFPSFILCAEPQSKDYQIQFKPFGEVIDIQGEGNIEVSKIEELGDSNKQHFVIKFVKDFDLDNINGDDSDKYSETLYSDLWGFGNLGNYSGITQFTDTGTAISSHLLNYTKYTNNGDLIVDEDSIRQVYGKNNADNPETEDDENEETVKPEDVIDGFNTIKSKYVGGLYNIGLNYLLKPEKLKSGETLIHNFQQDDIQLIPSHAQSIIIRITGDGSKAEFKYNNNITILKQTMVSGDITTVEVPLIPYAFYDADETDKTAENLIESKKFNISFSNCTAELLGYRV